MNRGALGVHLQALRDRTRPRARSWSGVAQSIVFLSGGIAIWMTQSANPDIQKWACLFGLSGQPIWIWSTYKSRQWCMLFLTFAYTAAWLKGLVSLIY